MTLGALRVSALALSAAALVLSSPLSAANAATVARHYQHATHYQHAAHSRVAHARVAHGVHEYVARGHAGHRHYVWRNGHRYAYGYNPGAAVAAGVIGGVAAGYPYSCDYSYSGPYGGYDYGDYADYGYDYGPYYGWLWLWPRLPRSPLWLRPRLPRKRRSASRTETSATWAASAAATSAASAAATWAALAAATWAALAAATSAAIWRRRALPLTHGFASPSASGGLRAARFCLAKPLGSKTTPS